MAFHLSHGQLGFAGRHPVASDHNTGLTPSYLVPQMVNPMPDSLVGRPSAGFLGLPEFGPLHVKAVPRP